MSTIDEQDWLAGADVQPERPRNTGGRKRTNGTGDRSRKIECPSCGFIARCSAGALERAGFPTCGCGERLELPNLRDRVRLEYDAVADEIARFSPREQNRIWRELGYLDLVVPLDSDGHIAAGGSDIGGERRRWTCAWDGGYCSKFVRGPRSYCPEHSAGTGEHELQRGA